MRDAAKLYDKRTPGAVSLDAFGCSAMEPHVFKEQLKRVFNLKVTAPELGALMRVFDVDGDGTVSCEEFTKVFIAMGFAEREREIRETKEKNRLAEIAKKEEIARKEKEKMDKHQLECSYEYTQEEFQSALSKLTDAAWRYDKTMPGAPNLSAFDSKEMRPFEFKEQMKRAFKMTISPPELGALMSIFGKDGIIGCANFLAKFLKVGVAERTRRNQQWREMQLKEEEAKKQKKLEEQQLLEKKNAMKVQKTFTDQDFQSAYAKLTDAAIKYHKDAPGAVGLNAFECVSMPPHVFKEQLKGVFGIKVTPQELGALMSYFDNVNELNCQYFLMRFFRIGNEERYRIANTWKASQKERAEKERVEREERLAESMNRGKVDIDTNFLEADFDSALDKVIILL